MEEERIRDFEWEVGGGKRKRGGHCVGFVYRLIDEERFNKQV